MQFRERDDATDATFEIRFGPVDASAACNSDTAFGTAVGFTDRSTEQRHQGRTVLGHERFYARGREGPASHPHMAEMMMLAVGPARTFLPFPRPLAFGSRLK